MTPEAAAAAPANDAAPPRLARFFSAENRYLPPLFITTILLVGQLSFGVLESFSRTLLAIGTAMLFELVLAPLAVRQVPAPGQRLHHRHQRRAFWCARPEYWPYALTSAIAITSKYVLRWQGRHLWNPSNFAICAMLLLAPEYVATLSIQWGNTIWPMMVVWVLGASSSTGCSVSTSRPLTWFRFSRWRRCAARSPATRSWRKWRRSPVRCTSSSSSS